MRVVKDEPYYVALPHKITIREALRNNKYDYVVLLIKRWRVK
jgi:hypothetical protein